MYVGDPWRVCACLGAAGVCLFPRADPAHRRAQCVPRGPVGALPQGLGGHEGGARSGHTRYEVDVSMYVCMYVCMYDLKFMYVQYVCTVKKVLCMYVQYMYVCMHSMYVQYVCGML